MAVVWHGMCMCVVWHVYGMACACAWYGTCMAWHVDSVTSWHVHVYGVYMSDTAWHGHDMAWVWHVHGVAWHVD